MNNSLPRLIDGMCATLRSEVLTRLDDEFARGQVFGVINLLNTFKLRADWSTGFLIEQIASQQAALDGVAALLGDVPFAPAAGTPAAPTATPVAELLALRDDGNRRIGQWLDWLDRQRASLAPDAVANGEALLRQAMRDELRIELRNAPRPLFAEMSSGSES